MAAVGALSSLPMLSTAFTIGDVMRNSIAAFAKQDVARHEPEKRSLISEILADIENLTECSACEVSEASHDGLADRTLLT